MDCNSYEAPGLEERSRKRSRFLRKVRWALFAMFAPDVEALQEQQWSLALGLFAVMGGVEIRHKTVRGIHYSDATKYTLTPQGVLLLFELGLLPDVRYLQDAVKDKTCKADSLAKGMVCVQLEAIWMLAETIARSVYALSITLL